MIHTLNAYLDTESDLYLYDDKPLGVFKEPLVRSTTDAIHGILLSAGLWDDENSKPKRVTLRFCAVSDEPLRMYSNELPIVRLHYRRKDSGMCVYLVEGWFPQSFTDERDFIDDMAGPTEVELCEHLLDYFSKAPAIFYCQVSLAEPSDGPRSAHAVEPA